jgi:hypothetical protein
MSLANFDKAAALYRESPWALYYFDHSPHQAALWLCDTHLAAAPTNVAALLSAAWYAHDAAHLPLDGPAPYGHLFKHRSPPASTRLPTLQAQHPDAFYEEFSGDKPYTLLLGQKIAPHAFTTHPNIQWVRSCREAYQWAHAYGLHAAHEYKRRTGHAHKAQPLLWTLENLPPDLLDDDDGMFTPDPDVPGACLLVIDGNLDTVNSYRLDFITNKRALWGWRNAPQPPWLEHYKEEDNTSEEPD